MGKNISERQSEPQVRNTEAERSLAEQPAFYLIYQIFYFTPWFFQRPDVQDIVIGLGAVGSFIPVYLYAMGSNPYRNGVVPLRVVLGAGYASILALALANVNGMSGNFHIFAVTLLAGLQPRLYALAAMIGISAVYLSASSLLGVSLFEICLSQFIAIMAGLATRTGFENARQVSIRERALRMEAELAALRERERIARDLHDVLGHTLTTIAVKSELAAKLIDKQPDSASREITEIRDAARATLKDVRSAVAGMQITTLVDEITRAHSALQTAGVKLSVTGEPPVLDDRSASALGLVLREAVTNIIRHSDATHAHIRFDAGASLQIEDNGSGGELTDGTGLVGMRRRIETLGGDMVAASSPKGVRLTFSLPPNAQMESGA